MSFWGGHPRIHTLGYVSVDTIGTRIRYARHCAGLQQTDVAGDLRVDQTTVSKWERDAGPPPRADQVMDLSRLFGCDPMWILAGGADRKPKAAA